MRRSRWLIIALVVLVLSGLGSFYLMHLNSLNLQDSDYMSQNGQSDTDEVPPDQVQKYINVYQSMDRNRGLTVEQAAAQQGLSLEAFRDIERRIERDDLVREHVRQELQKSAKSTSAPAVAKP